MGNNTRIATLLNGAISLLAVVAITLVCIVPTAFAEDGANTSDAPGAGADNSVDSPEARARVRNVESCVSVMQPGCWRNSFHKGPLGPIRDISVEVCFDQYFKETIMCFERKR